MLAAIVGYNYILNNILFSGKLLPQKHILRKKEEFGYGKYNSSHGMEILYTLVEHGPSEIVGACELERILIFCEFCSIGQLLASKYL